MTKYSKTIKEIFDLQIFAIKLGLDNITALCSFLGDPQKEFPSIHIAGTNGKGSTAFYIAHLLQANGLKTGLYTSPHLYDFRERIRINGEKISEEYILEFWDRAKPLVMERKATFFDTTTAMAFDYFKYNEVDVAIIETGLGGRLDSTNILKPKISVITPVNYDHQKQLGDSLASIMTEKAGIVKNGIPVFSAGQRPEAMLRLKRELNANNALYYLPDLVNTKIINRSISSICFELYDLYNDKAFKNLQTIQVGDFQVDNIALAYLAGRFYLKAQSIEFRENIFRRILKETYWPGRLELVKKNPAIIFDVSHNLHGISKSLSYLSKIIDKEKLVILVGLVQDKDITKIVKEIIKYSSKIIITEPETHRKLEADELSKAFNNNNVNVKIIKDSQKAYELSLSSLNQGEYLLVIGSHYLIGSLKKQ